jgi:Aerotolerance regulator N-terminal
MQFLFPIFLTAALALAVPIIIHLFHFRRFKTVYFTNVRWLKELKEETANRSKLRNLLVLASRMLALGALVLGFAQPFIPRGKDVKAGEKAVSIFIDNSFSMSALSKDVPLLEAAKKRARDIVNAYAIEDKFQIITNDFEGRHQRLVSKEEALGLVDEVKISPSTRVLSKVLTRQIQTLNSGKAVNKSSFIISDFQQNIADFKNIRDTSTEINLAPLAAVQERNVSVDSVWFEAPVQMLNQTNRLLVRVTNRSTDKAEDIRLTLTHEGQVKPGGTLSIPANGSKTDTMNMTILKTGWHEAEVGITDYPVQFDDKYSVTFNVAQEVNLLSLNENAPNRYLNNAFSGANYFKITNQDARNIDYSKLKNYQLIVLNGLNNVSSGLASELKQYVQNGGNVLFFPTATGNIESYKSFLSGLQANNFLNFEPLPREVSNINTDEFVFKDVFENKNANLKLPTSQGNFKAISGARGEEALLSYRDGSPFLGKTTVEQGNLYTCYAPLDEKYSDLARNGEIFVPMLYKMAISTGKTKRIAYTIGKDNVLDADNKAVGNETVYKLKGKAEEFIPQQRIVNSKVILTVGNEMRESGIYNLYLKPEAIVSKFAFNYDRKESDLKYFDAAALKDFTRSNIKLFDTAAEANFTQLVGEREQGTSLWRWCLGAVLLFLALETMLLRFWKV